MKKHLFLLCLLLPLLTACDPCSNLREKDEKIMTDFKELQEKGMEETDIRYTTKLRVLYEQEKALLRQVRNCEIEDPIEYNYWYGERLKYPSELEQTYIRLSRKP